MTIVYLFVCLFHSFREAVRVRVRERQRDCLSTMEPYTVQAEYSFQGENNDELRFKKGDIITVTQREDGGWWEGTLGEMTGWFPSNYVKEYKGEFKTHNKWNWIFC